ncbi:arsenic resistance protein [Gordonia sp. DT30]|uniref:arsenic resistance protein n=1 Tax=unclassified Gordonia (in: high G+C Gram-positive bacteria) TaxID=2657482 RepID=UPI003CF7C84D
MERHQVVCYLSAILVGALLGFGVPSAGTVLSNVITPALAALLYVTFLQVPARSLVSALRDVRFLGAVLVVNFAVVPLVVAAMYAFMPDDQALRFGMLLVLLCPCVDYVIVFTGLAGGDNVRLLASTPVLLIVQMAVLPLLLTAFLGADLAAVIDAGPFLEAVVALIAIPLAAAWGTQWWSGRHRSGQQFSAGVSNAMVPLMMIVLAVVVASEISAIGDAVSQVLRAIGFYVVFLVVMAPAGVVIGRLFGLSVSSVRATAFSGATRNSLVVLPLALALPPGFEVAAVAVVAQTLVEVIGMVTYVRLIPLLAPARR